MFAFNFYEIFTSERVVQNAHDLAHITQVPLLVGVSIYAFESIGLGIRRKLIFSSFYTKQLCLSPSSLQHSQFNAGHRIVPGTIPQNDNFSMVLVLGFWSVRCASECRQDGRNLPIFFT